MISLLLLFQLSIVNVVTDYTTCYSDVLGLDEWVIEIEFIKIEEEDVVAHTEVWADYLVATIVYDPDKLKIESDSSLRQIVVHELGHVWTWELGLLAEEANESWALRLQEQMLTRMERWSTWQKVCN